jgi:hypothetical protein
MTNVEEGALIVSLPDDRYFRIEGTAAHDAISGHRVKVVDFGWQYEDEPLWLMELKNLGAGIPATLREKLDDFRDALPAKIVHSLLMLGAMWGGTPFGEMLRRELEETFPDLPTQPVSVRAAVVINVEPPVDEQMLFALSDSIENAVHAMGVERVAVIPVGAPEIRDRLGIRVVERET